MESREFFIACNEPGEFVEDAKIQKLQDLAKLTYMEDGKQISLITENELLNLSMFLFQ